MWQVWQVIRHPDLSAERYPRFRCGDRLDPLRKPADRHGMGFIVREHPVKRRNEFWVEHVTKTVELDGTEIS